MSDKDLRFSKAVTRFYREQGHKHPHSLAMIYSYIRYWCKNGEGGVCRVKVTRVAAWFEFSRQTVYRCYATLEEDGLIQKSQDGTGWVLTGKIPDTADTVLTEQGVMAVL